MHTDYGTAPAHLSIARNSVAATVQLTRPRPLPVFCVAVRCLQHPLSCSTNLQIRRLAGTNA
eukprot:1109657-Amphidinium_carterae.1